MEKQKDKQGAPLFQACVEPLLRWYDQHARILPWRESTEPYRVWISEIMLQQTRVEAVIPYYERFLRTLPDLSALAEAPEEQLLKLWEGLGYYNRVRNLQKAAQRILRENSGVFPADRRELCKLPGIGDYTAGAIASICFGLPEPAVDGNVMRVAARLLEDRRDILQPAFRQEIARELQQVYPAGRCGDFTQSLMELGALICLPNGAPLCAECPLSSFCRAYRHGTADQLPVKKKAKERRCEQRTVFLLRCGEALALRKRPARGLLAGLWELPNIEGKLDLRGAKKQLSEWGISFREVSSAGKEKHIFSHIEWQMSVYRAECESPAAVFDWLPQNDLSVSLPTAFRDLLTLLPGAKR